MKKQNVIQKLIQDNRHFIKFACLGESEINGCQELLDDLNSGNLKNHDHYTQEMQKWLKYNGINLDEIKDD